MSRKFIFLVFCLILLLTSLRLFNYQSKMLWNVEQSFTFWNIHKTVESRKPSLIGTHLFSLIDGAIYRSPFADWGYALVFLAFGEKLSSIVGVMLLVEILGSIFLVMAIKKISSATSALVTCLIWVSSSFVYRQEFQFWYVAFMIPLSTICIWFIFRNMQKNSFWEYLILGLLMGLGFSFHFVILWFIAGVLIYLISKKSKDVVKICLPISLGIIIMLLPLLVFNVRHDFVMNRGVANLIFGKAIHEGADPYSRLSTSLATINCLLGGIMNIPCSNPSPTIIMATILSIGLVKFTGGARDYFRFYFIQILISYFGIYYAGRMSYGSQHYVLYLIPMTFILFALVFNKLLATKFKPILYILVYLLVMSNINMIGAYVDPNSYDNKANLVRYLLTLKQDRIIVKSMDEDALSFDSVFYLATRESNLPTSKLSVVDKWTHENPTHLIYSKNVPIGLKDTMLFGDIKLVSIGL